MIGGRFRRAAMLTALLLGSARCSPSSGQQVRTLPGPDASRPVLVHLPRGDAGSERLPVVLALHGGGSNASTMKRFTGLDAAADAHRFIVAYPSGTGRLSRVLTWNAGRCCGGAERDQADDVGYLDRVIDDLIRTYRADPARVYLTGMSNGAMMAHRYAAERPERVAAIAPVSGGLEVDPATLRAPVPVLHIHGTADEHLPFEGGHGPRSAPGNFHTSIPATVAAWVARNGAAAEAVTTFLPDKAADGMRVERQVHAAGSAGAEVVLLLVRGGGHTWPGHPSRERLLGPTTRDINANEVMWEFFSGHRH